MRLDQRFFVIGLSGLVGCGDEPSTIDGAVDVFFTCKSERPLDPTCGLSQPEPEPEDQKPKYCVYGNDGCTTYSKNPGEACRQGYVEVARDEFEKDHRYACYTEL